MGMRGGDAVTARINMIKYVLKSLRSVQISILKPKKYHRSSKNLSVL